MARPERKKRALFIWLALLSLCLVSALAVALGRLPVARVSRGDAAAQPPSEAPAEAPAAPDYGEVRISELMVKNKATLLSPGGEFCAWAELENCSDAPVELAGWRLGVSARKAMVLGGRLEPGERRVIFFENGSIVKLSKDDELRLYAPDGGRADSLLCVSAQADCSVCAGDGESDVCEYPTPGYANSAAGYDAFQADRAAPGPLVIAEVMVYNDSLPLCALGCCDWVEIRNVSGQNVDLGGWYLSDSVGDRHKWAFPERTLPAGESVLVFCAGESGVGTDALYSGFSLNSERETLYLSEHDTLVDYAAIHGLHYGHSFGRMSGQNGFFYFDTPTPGRENRGGLRRYSGSVSADRPGGVYNEAVTVTLSAPGAVYYTLDGSVPDASDARSTGPITLDASTPLRAVCIEEGCLPGPVLSLTYLIGEDEDLDVLALCVEPDDFDGPKGIYTGSDKKKSAIGNLSLYGRDGSFSMDCEVRLRGNKLTGQTQKGLRFGFRGCTGGLLDYPLFGEEKRYHSLMIRDGRSREHYYISDPVYTQLVKETAASLLYQDWRYVSVYVNGRYFGLYQLRERFSEQDLAERWNVDSESVEIVRSSERDGTDLGELFTWVQWTNLSKDKNYRALAERLDLESLAEWFIIEAFSGNIDTLTNVKFARSEQYDGKWHILLFDLDRAMQINRGIDGIEAQTAVGIPELYRKLIQNPDFRTLLLEKAAAMRRRGLTTERLLAVLDEVYADTHRQMHRSLLRWKRDADGFDAGYTSLRARIVSGDPERKLLESLKKQFGLSDGEYRSLFG